MWTWQITFKNNRAPPPCYFKLDHRLIKTGVNVWKRIIRVKVGDLLSRLTLKFDTLKNRRCLMWNPTSISREYYVRITFLMTEVWRRAPGDTAYRKIPLGLRIQVNNGNLLLGISKSWVRDNDSSAPFVYLDVNIAVSPDKFMSQRVYRPSHDKWSINQLWKIVVHLTGHLWSCWSPREIKPNFNEKNLVPNKYFFIAILVVMLSTNCLYGA